jgi:GNAT superfamily N-acetyltransferase
VIPGPSAPFACEPIDRARAAALGELFDRAGSACHCQYWHFTGDKNEWQARLAFEPGANRRALFERAIRSPPRGVVAVLEGGAVIGWMKLEPALELGKLYDQRIYRGLSCLGGDRRGVWTLGCFLVDPAHRRRGVARAMVRRGIELAREHGGQSLEAFPRRAEGVGDEELWTGPFALLQNEGFEIVHEQAQYPVLRRSL